MKFIGYYEKKKKRNSSIVSSVCQQILSHGWDCIWKSSNSWNCLLSFKQLNFQLFLEREHSEWMFIQTSTFIRSIIALEYLLQNLECDSKLRSRRIGAIVKF